jgi:UDP:flavonoid glycosyltransferase YjiC (YdhE family)
MGINLRTNTPTTRMLRDAVRIVLDTDRYRLRASLMAEEFQLIDTRSEILRTIDEVSQSSAPSIRAAAKKVNEYRPRR